MGWFSKAWNKVKSVFSGGRDRSRGGFDRRTRDRNRRRGGRRNVGSRRRNRGDDSYRYQRIGSSGSRFREAEQNDYNTLLREVKTAKENRWASAGIGLGKIAGFAGAGFLLGGPLGALAGGIAGLGASIGDFAKAFSPAGEKRAIAAYELKRHQREEDTEQGRITDKRYDLARGAIDDDIRDFKRMEDIRFDRFLLDLEQKERKLRGTKDSVSLKFDAARSGIEGSLERLRLDVSIINQKSDIMTDQLNSAYAQVLSSSELERDMLSGYKSAALQSYNLASREVKAATSENFGKFLRAFSGVDPKLASSDKLLEEVKAAEQLTLASAALNVEQAKVGAAHDKLKYELNSRIFDIYGKEAKVDLNLQKADETLRFGLLENLRIKSDTLAKIGLEEKILNRSLSFLNREEDMLLSNIDDDLEFLQRLENLGREEHSARVESYVREATLRRNLTDLDYEAFLAGIQEFDVRYMGASFDRGMAAYDRNLSSAVQGLESLTSFYLKGKYGGGGGGMRTNPYPTDYKEVFG